MSLRSQHLSHHVAGNNLGFPNVGGGVTTKKPSTPKKTKEKQLSAEEKAEQAKLNDPYGDHKTGGAQRKTRVVRRKVRRRRVGNQGQTPATTTTSKAAPNYGTSKAQQAQQAKQAKQQMQAKGTGGDPQAHMMKRMDAQSSLNRMSAGFINNQSQANGPQTPVGKKMAMLGNLANYMNNDYNAMKCNENDKAFTYRTSEARQLCATLGTMVASATKSNNKDTKSSSDTKKPITPKQFAAQKGLLKKLKMMSDPSFHLPEGLPADYKPMELTA